MSVNFTQAAIVAAIVLGGVGIYSISTHGQRLATKPEKPYLYLKVSDCPTSRGFEAIFRDGEFAPGGWWVMKVASETIQVRPPESCWQAMQALPATYKGGDKFRFSGEATPSAKAGK